MTLAHPCLLVSTVSWILREDRTWDLTAAAMLALGWRTIDLAIAIVKLRLARIEHATATLKLRTATLSHSAAVPARAVADYASLSRPSVAEGAQ